VEIKQYTIVLVNLDPTIGSEIGKTRTCTYGFDFLEELENPYLILYQEITTLNPSPK